MRKWRPCCVKHAIEFIDDATPAVGLAVKVDNKYVLNHGAVAGSSISKRSALLTPEEAARL
jgi:hypothetical protein